MYWTPEGTPITALEFVKKMFNDLPQFFENEDQLREIWSSPDTREKLLADLSEAGYDEEKLDGRGGSILYLLRLYSFHPSHS